MFQADNPRNQTGRPVMATIGVGDIERAATAYCELLGYERVNAQPMSQAYADIWGESSLADRPSKLLKPQSGAPVFIRLVEADQDAEILSPPQAGWFALEICVQDSAALYEKLCQHDYFEPFAPPRVLPFSDKVFPFQCRGGNGELLYLNETRGNLPEIDLPLANSFVDHIFIVVLGASQIDGSADFYTKLLQANLQESHELAYRTINRVFDLPLETLHKLKTFGSGRNVSLEIDQLPVQARTRGHSPDIARGICCVSFSANSSDELADTATRLSDAPYNSRQVSHVFGPDDERLELIVIEEP